MPVDDDITRVYISGPYTLGEWGSNVYNACEAAERVYQAGYIPFIPHTMVALWSVTHKREGEVWLDFDLPWVDACDVLIRLPGESSGSDKELRYAKHIGIDVYDGRELDDPVAVFLQDYGERERPNYDGVHR